MMSILFNDNAPLTRKKYLNRRARLKSYESKKSIKHIIFMLLIIITFYYYFIQKTLHKKIFHHLFSNNKVNYFNIPEKEIDINNITEINEEAERLKNFILNINKGILLGNFSKELLEIKVSVVIPVYNARDYIKRGIRSIQNQNMKELEIIIINDFSTDKTLELLEEFKKEDIRIKILNNKKNMGQLYSRCIGTLASKGKYIFPFDSDDFFINDNIINYVYQQALKNDNDIIEFKSFVAWSSFDLLKHRMDVLKMPKNDSTIYQPALGCKANNCTFLWGKCYKTELYKKSIKMLGEENYLNHITITEDCIINYIIFQNAKSLKYINKYGYFHKHRLGSNSRTRTKIQVFKGELLYDEVIFKHSKNTYEGKSVLLMRFRKFSKKFNLNNILMDNTCLNSFSGLLKKIFDSKYVSPEVKEKISKLFLEYKLLNITRI